MTDNSSGEQNARPVSFDHVSVYEYLGIGLDFEKSARRGRVRPTDIEEDIKEVSGRNDAVYADIVRAFSEEDLKYNMLQSYKLAVEKKYPVKLLKSLDLADVPDPIDPKTIFMIAQEYLNIDVETERAKIKQTLSGSADRRLRGHLLIIGLTDAAYSMIFGHEGLTPAEEEVTIIEETGNNVFVSLGLMMVGIVPILTVLILVLPLNGVISRSEPGMGLAMVILTIVGALTMVFGFLRSGLKKNYFLYGGLLAFAVLNLIIVLFSDAGGNSLEGLTGVNPPYISISGIGVVFNSVVQVAISLIMVALIFNIATRVEAMITLEGVAATVIGLVLAGLAPAQVFNGFFSQAVSGGSVLYPFPSYAFFNEYGIPYHPFLGISENVSIISTTSYFYYVASLTMAIAANLLFSFIYFVIALRVFRGTLSN